MTENKTTEWHAPTFSIGEGRKTVWLADYRFANALTGEAEAITLATGQALREVPDATVKVMNVRRTPTGRWVVTVKRDRSAAVTADELMPHVGHPVHVQLNASPVTGRRRSASGYMDNIRNSGLSLIGKNERRIDYSEIESIGCSKDGWSWKVAQ